ncbi:MAG TPA: hypothetical protein PKX36_04965 [Candidatus Cloacimonadota bacterium]|nr:hypothetical protein [Candidatus Cloacimonadota bacterium]
MKVRTVSQIRDIDSSSDVINDNRIGFTISLKGREIVEVSEPYHYADWGPVKMRIKQLRDDLITRIEEIDPDFVDKKNAKA